MRVTRAERQVWADPPDINVLPEYGNDPRTVDNLLDGHNHTCDATDDPRPRPARARRSRFDAPRPWLVLSRAAR